MDDLKHSRKKADGIRRQTDPMIPRRTLPEGGPPTQRASPPGGPPVKRAADLAAVKNVREKSGGTAQEEASGILPEKHSFLERSNRTMRAAKDTRVIHDRSFKKEVLPGSPLLGRKNFVALFSVLVLTVITAVLLSTVFARVTITVKPAVESVQIDNTQISFDASASDINAATRTVPSEFLSFNGSAAEDFNATGSSAADQKASGRVRIYNASAASPQQLVATTRFITDSGLLFRLAKSVTIPAAKKDEKGALVPQFVEADLIADKAGEGSNIAGEVRLHIPGFKGTPKYDGFYAVATNGFAGGSAGLGRMVTHDDLVAAQQKLSKKVFDDLRRGMAQKIPAHFTYVDSLSEIEITGITAPKEKTKTDRFTVEVKAVARVFVFRNADLVKLLNQLLLKPEDMKILVDSSADFHYQIKNANYDKKIADVSMSGSIKSKKVVQSSELAILAVGKKEGSLIDALKQRRDISTFRVAFFPPWIFAAPGNANQIIIIFEDPAGKGK